MPQSGKEHTLESDQHGTPRLAAHTTLESAHHAPRGEEQILESDRVLIPTLPFITCMKLEITVIKVSTPFGYCQDSTARMVLVRAYAALIFQSMTDKSCTICRHHYARRKRKYS